MAGSQDKIPLSRVDVDRIESMRKSIMNHEVAKTLIFDSFLADGWLSVNEKELFWNAYASIPSSGSLEDVIAGTIQIPMKCKVDRIIWNPKTGEICIIDLKTNSLKTTKKSYLEQLKEDILVEYDYDRQAAVYRSAVLSNSKLFTDIFPHDVKVSNYIVASQSNIINETRLIKFSEDTITNGWYKASLLLNNLAIGLKYGFDHDPFYYLSDNKTLTI